MFLSAASSGLANIVTTEMMSGVLDEILGLLVFPSFRVSCTVPDMASMPPGIVGGLFYLKGVFEHEFSK